MKRVFSIIGVIIGILMIVLGLKLYGNINAISYNGSLTSGYTFGADYYTEQYAATKNTADNVNALGSYVENSIKATGSTVGLFISLLGCVVICYFGSKFEIDKAKKQISEKIITDNNYSNVSQEIVPPVHKADLSNNDTSIQEVDLSNNDTQQQENNI